MLGRGDTVVIPEGLERQVTARTDVHLLVCGHGNAIVPWVPWDARLDRMNAPRGQVAA